MWGHRYKGQYDVAQSLEFATQCIRVCRKASEMFGGMWSLVYKVILWQWGKIHIGNGAAIVQHGDFDDSKNCKVSFVQVCDDFICFSFKDFILTNSLWQYEALIDTNAWHQNVPKNLKWRVFYGWLEYDLKCILPVNYTPDNPEPGTLLLALITTCNTHGHDAIQEEVFFKDLNLYPGIIDIRTICAIVDHIRVRDVWAVINRNGASAQMVFTDDLSTAAGASTVDLHIVTSPVLFTQLTHFHNVC